MNTTSTSQLRLLAIASGLVLFACVGSSDTTREQSDTEGPTILEPQPQTAEQTISKWRFESSIRSMLEDSQGNMWFGSNSEGVCRYDGKSFTYFSAQDGLAGNQIHSIQEDRFGRIWFGTGRGPSFFDGSTMHTPSLVNVGFEDARAKDNAGNPGHNWGLDPSDLWFEAIHKSGILRLHGEELSYLPFPIPAKDTTFDKDDQHLPPYSIFTAHKTYDDEVWFGTMSRGAVGFDGTTFTYLNEDHGGLTLVRSVFKDRSGNLWIGDNGAGLYHYDGNKLTNFTDQHGLGNPGFTRGNIRDRPGTLARVWAIEQDTNDDMWFGTIDAGVWRYNGEKLTNYTTEHGLPSYSIEAIYKDRAGTLWFGTAQGGVCTFDGTSFVRFANSGPETPQPPTCVAFPEPSKPFGIFK